MSHWAGFLRQLVCDNAIFAELEGLRIQKPERIAVRHEIGVSMTKTKNEDILITCGMAVSKPPTYYTSRNHEKR